MDIFERASKQKLRFETSQGFLSTEDLWDLSLTSLDTIAKKVNKQIRDEGEESFLPSKSSKATTQNNLRLEILKHVIDVKVQDQEAKKTRADKMAKLVQLKELAQAKTTEQLAAQSLDDINKQIAELSESLV